MAVFPASSSNPVLKGTNGAVKILLWPNDPIITTRKVEHMTLRLYS